MIREATLVDIPTLVSLGCAFMRESGYSAHFAINRQAQTRLAMKLIRSPTGKVFVDESNREVVGMIGVIATDHPHSGDCCLSELFWYVSPYHRGSGVRLLKAAEKWGREIGARKFLVVSPTAKVSEFYRRVGFAPLEEQFIMDIQS